MKRFYKRAFTLAEVLITLGIIGVIAALTIPTLINNYQKIQTVSKLKETYSILSQAITKAQVENGDISTWGFSSIYGVSAYDPLITRKTISERFFINYLKPNLKISKEYGFFNPYNEVKTPDNSLWFTLSNGTLIGVTVSNSGCLTFDDKGSCIEAILKNIVFRIDINGINNPNTSGKDVFLMELDVRKNIFGFYKYDSTSRTYYLNQCSGNSGNDDGLNLCGYLIFLDNWTIADDYPWFK